jgi:glycosyltransferase involved in cell wall biosynthesis
MSLAPTIDVVLHTLRHELAARARRTARRASRATSPLRIGVDIRPFYEPLTGVGWYLHHLLHELAKHDDVELLLLGDARVTDEGPRLHTSLPPRARTLVFDLAGRPLSRLSRPITAGAYVGLLELADLDLVFGANYFLPRLHSAIARRRVVTVHDLTFKRFPELLQKETLENLDRNMRRELAWSDAVICVSESTRRDLLHYYDVDPSRAFTVLSGLADPLAGAPIAGLPERYILFVSTIEPRKNLRVLLDAYQQLRASGAYGGSLVVVGKVGWKSESLLPRLREPGVVHLDYVQADQLATIYAKADTFVFPSIYEGFGFPLLEAMAHGVSTIAADSSSLPEVGGDATLYFQPHDVEALTMQLRRVLTEPATRESLIARGRAQVAQFRWSRAAEETLAVFRRVTS